MQNATIQALLSVNLKSDEATIQKLIAKGGASTAEFLGAFVSPEIVPSFNQKRVLTMVKLANFVTSGGTADYMRESAILGAMLALIPEGTQVEFDAARWNMGARLKEDATRSTTIIPGVSRAKLQRHFEGDVNWSTVCTRLSQIAVMWEALGVLTRSAHGFTVTNRNVPVLVAYAHALDQMTEGALQLTRKK